MKQKLMVLTSMITVIYLLNLGACTGCNGCNNVQFAWTHWRGDPFRSGTALFETALGDPNAVSTLHVAWTFNLPGGGGFHASPVVSGNVFIGGGNGYFYCLDGSDGHVVWQYPAATSPALTSQFTGGNPSGLGIASSGALTVVGNTNAVIFGAPDQSSGSHLGDGHLFALDVSNGHLLWESPPIALVTGTTSSSTTELHQQIGYSAPLIFNDHVYIGIADHGDNPIQQGKVIAVHVADGTLDNAFNFAATPVRGGGVWGSLAEWEDVYVTTGNTSDCAGCEGPEPNPNHGNSMLRLNKDSGNVVWKQHPVPYNLDNDPDWAAGPAVMYAADCGPAIISTEKDGWTWAVRAGTGAPGAPSVMWSFPPGPWTTSGFHQGDGTSHGDTDYKRPGATWGDVYIGVTGGYETQTNLSRGYTQLHALNVCGPDNQRVRWLSDIPGTSGGSAYYPLGSPTVTQAGMVFVGTSAGHVVAIADPTIHPALGNRCEDPGISSANCVAAGRRLVPDPWIHDMTLPGSPSDGVFGEIAIANGNLYVATVDGHVYMLRP